MRKHTQRLIVIKVPRDHNASFDPQKGQTRITGMDDQVLSHAIKLICKQLIVGHMIMITGIGQGSFQATKVSLFD